VKRALETAPAELVTDIAHSGIVLTGGGALLGNLGRRLTNELGLESASPMNRSPARCVARARRLPPVCSTTALRMI
jgi:Actin-like ATPase involved in cell morphogenesis